VEGCRCVEEEHRESEGCAKEKKLEVHDAAERVLFCFVWDEGGGGREGVACF
jgi:hypothetical protein